MRRPRAVAAACLLLASSLGCETPSAGSLSLPPLPTPAQEREIAIVDELRDPVTGALLLPELRAWHGEVADYFCEVLVTQGAIGADECAGAGDR